MKIAVCDDSRTDRENLISLLREYEESKGTEFEIAELQNYFSGYKYG